MAVCQYDIENQPYEITIPAWKDYWSLAMYSQKGNVFFSIFDRQVTIDKLQVKLVRQSADKPAGGPQGEGASEDLTIVEAPQTRGWIVLRALATSRAMKARRQSEVTNATRCKPVSGAKN
ncbi:MAG TPA: DUF1254 domain-containing protein [Rhizobiales bacterium]|nr:DUF1254 domain-containing protein [Hyphomicrobiales bacterium]